VEPLLVELLGLLLNDEVLASKFCDHPLSGEWKDHRDCHVKPDLVLIYRKPSDTVLQLVRIGSHSELGL
jgi:mRNA interferase YafQ